MLFAAIAANGGISLYVAPLVLLWRIKSPIALPRGRVERNGGTFVLDFVENDSDLRQRRVGRGAGRRRRKPVQKKSGAFLAVHITLLSYDFYIIFNLLANERGSRICRQTSHRSDPIVLWTA